MVVTVAACSSNESSSSTSTSSSGASGTSGSTSGEPDGGGGSGDAGCTATICGGACVDTATDPKNCGGCGMACGGGSVCAASACKCASTNEACDASKGGKCDLSGHCHEDTLLGGTQFGSGVPSLIAVGSTFALMAYTAGKGYEVARAGFDGTTQVLKSDGVSAQVAADGGDFGFSVPQYLGAPPAIYTCAATSCSSTLSGHFGGALQIYNASFYFRGTSGMFQRCPLSGCGTTPEDLTATPTPTGAVPAVIIRMDASGAYGLFGSTVAKWTEESAAWAPLYEAVFSSRPHLAIDDTTVYSVSDDGIVSCAKAGCASAPTTVIAAGGKARGIAVKGTHLYWVTPAVSGAPSDLMRCAKGATCVPEKVASGFGDLLAEDATHLYFAAESPPSSPRVRRFSK